MQLNCALFPTQNNTSLRLSILAPNQRKLSDQQRLCNLIPMRLERLKHVNNKKQKEGTPVQGLRFSFDGVGCLP